MVLSLCTRERDRNDLLFLTLLSDKVSPTKVSKLLDSDVNKISKFLFKHQMQQKTLNRIFKTPSHHEHMILSSSMNEKTYMIS